MIGTLCCRKFLNPDFSLCRSQKIFPWAKKFRESEKNQHCEGLHMVPYCCCLRLTWANSSKLQAVPKPKPGRPRNQRAAKKLGLCNAQRSSQSLGKSAWNFFTHENNPQKRPGTDLQTQSKKGSALSSTELPTKCQQSSTFCLPSATTAFNKYSTGRS